MVKYHISSDGTPNPCEARKKPCRLGEGKPHFKTKEAAREYYEKDNASKTIAKPLTKNNPSDKRLKLEKELEIESKDENIDVRESVAFSNHTPAHILEKLSKDKDSNVRVAAFRALEKL